MQQTRQLLQAAETTENEYKGISRNDLLLDCQHTDLLELLRTEEEYVGPEAADMVFHNAAWPELDLMSLPDLEEESDPADREVTSGLDISSDDEGQWADLEFSGDTWKLLHGVPEDPTPGQVVVMRSYAAGAKKAVIDRDTDLLTSAELQTE